MLRTAISYSIISAVVLQSPHPASAGTIKTIAKVSVCASILYLAAVEVTNGDSDSPTMRYSADTPTLSIVRDQLQNDARSMKALVQNMQDAIGDDQNIANPANKNLLETMRLLGPAAVASNANILARNAFYLARLDGKTKSIDVLRVENQVLRSGIRAGEYLTLLLAIGALAKIAPKSSRRKSQEREGMNFKTAEVEPSEPVGAGWGILSWPSRKSRDDDDGGAPGGYAQTNQGGSTKSESEEGASAGNLPGTDAIIAINGNNNRSIGFKVGTENDGRSASSGTISAGMAGHVTTNRGGSVESSAEFLGRANHTVVGNDGERYEVETTRGFGGRTEGKISDNSGKEVGRTASEYNRLTGTTTTTVYDTDGRRVSSVVEGTVLGVPYVEERTHNDD